MKPEKPKINTSVFENFTKLTNNDENLRLNGAVCLIQQLENSSEEKQLDYAVKRLVRGNGSSTSSSRIGFYTTLTGLLSSEIENMPKVETILSLMNKEFKEGDESKVRVDSMIGIALVCGAIIRSEKALGTCTKDEIEEIVKNLTYCFTKPSVSPVASNFIAELITKVNTDLIKSSIWPHLTKHLNITKDKITIDSAYLLLLIEHHHQNTIDAIFYKKNWQTEKILCSDNLEIFANLLWKVDKINLINHPIYVYFMKRIVDLKFFKSFWLYHVDKTIEEEKTSSKFIEMITINSAISLLKNLESRPKEVLNLLTPNFLQMLYNQGTKLAKDEDLQEIYKEFYDSLDKLLQGLKNDSLKIQALETFSKFSVEKNSNNKFITNLINSLELEGLNSAITRIKLRMTDDPDEKERQYAATIFQKIISTNKLVSNNFDWRIEQLIFFSNLAFLKSKDGIEVEPLVEVNSIATNIKNIFYHLLEYKFPKINDEKKVLLGIINHLNSFMSKKDFDKYFQKPLDSKFRKTWNTMISEVTTKPDKKDKHLKTIFHVLLMHMGLQLFNNAELADNAINELIAVLERAVMKKSKEDEPEWIEVIVDLFLTLLSQESYVLRNVIRHVFPQLCSQISVSAFHQILSMLDIRSKDNPLQMKDDEDDESDEDVEEIDDEEDDEEMEIDENGVDDESEADDTSDIEDEEEEDTALVDSVRMAVQNALEDDENEGSDIDIDAISPKEGKKLNMALGNAFKLLMEQRNLKSKKKSKSVLMADKALLHFRMRLLDLIEIYLKNNPQMEICLEILIFFFDLMPVAVAQPELRSKFEKIFPQLSQLKTFSLETVQNVTQKNLAEILTNILEKTSREKTNIQQQNYFKDTMTFLIYSSQILQKLSPDEEDEVLKIIMQQMKEFFSQRNPTLQFNTFTKILSTQWIGNFKLAKMISEDGLKSDIRSLRRMQSLQMLREFFKNQHLFNQNQKKAAKYHTKIFDAVKIYAESLSEVSQPEFYELIYFMTSMKTVKDFPVKDELITAVQKFRQHHILKQNILNAYKTLCNKLKFEFVSNEKIDPTKVKNGEQKQEATVAQNGTQKRKKSAANMKEKKLKKIKQLQEASAGLDASFSFV